MSANSGGNSLYSLGSDLNNWLSPTSPAGYRNASQTSLDRFSEAESVESVDSFLSSPALKEQTIPGYNLLTHRLIWQELVRTISPSRSFPLKNRAKFKDLTGSVTMLDTYPIGSGGSADVYGGALSGSHWQPAEGPGRQVAIKIYRRMHSEPQELEQKSRVR
jgi:hypothetical protein